MLYRIGEVSEIFGVTNETLRNYERAGIIKSCRVEGSRYRYFDIVNVSKLIGIRTRRKEGFTMRELQQVYSNMDLNQYHALIEEKIAAQMRELEKQKYMLEKLTELEQHIDQITRDENICLQTQSPALYLLPYRQGELLNTAGIPSDCLINWTNNLFLVRNSATYSLDFSTFDSLDYRVALAVDVQTLGIRFCPPMEYRPPCPSVMCYCDREDISNPWPNCRNQLRTYLSTHSLRPAGDLFSLTLFGFHQKGIKHSFVQIYLPVVADP